MDSKMQDWDSEALIRRLRDKAKKFGKQEDLAVKSGIPLSTLRKILQGVTEPGFDKIVKLAQAMEVGLDDLAFGTDDESGDETTQAAQDTDFVPVYDQEVGAGDGSAVFDRPAASTIGFRREWVRARFGNADNLAILMVRGDSMEPELRDGDKVMIDRAQHALADGLFVITRAGDAQIKRLQRLARDRVRLLSTNTLYAPVEVDLTDEAEDFAIEGKAVWLGRSIG